MKKPAATMTDSELSKAARNYDNVMNEGGDGYNPYREEMSGRDHARAVAQHQAKMQTPEGKIEALQRRIRTECGSVARESRSNDEVDELQRDLYAQIDALQAEIVAAFAAEWTREETMARRTAWNDMVRGGKFGPMGGRFDHRAYMDQVKAQGWTMEDLKRAIKLHNL